MELNIVIFEWLHAFAGVNPFIDAVIRFIADPLGILIVLVVAWYLLHHHNHAHGLWELSAFFGAGFLASGVAFLVKEFFPTLRPFEYFLTLQPLITAPGAAFPSMHTAFYVAFGSAMTVAHPRGGMLITLLALLIGIARVASGAHWPFDILFGAVLGWTVGYISMKLCYQWMCRMLKVCIV